MNLYEIDAAIEEAVTKAMDPETGEILDEALWDSLDTLTMQRDTKIENIACWIKNLEADGKAIKAEEDNLKKRRQALESKSKWLRKYLQEFLGGKKFSTAKCAITYRKSESVQIDDKSAIPFLYSKVTTTPDKTAIKKAIKAGKTVLGAKLVTNQNMQIK